MDTCHPSKLIDYQEQTLMHTMDFMSLCVNADTSAVTNVPCRENTDNEGGNDPLEEEMATHSSVLAWRIPWTEEPGGLQSMGSQRVGHD